VNAAVKTFDEHRDYFFEIVKLKLWFVFGWLREHPDETFLFAFRERIDIYRKTNLYMGGPLPAPVVRFADPRWQALETKLESIFQAHRNAATAAAFEAEGFACLMPTIEAGAVLDYARELSGEFMKGFQCGSLRYDPPTPEQPTTTPIHIVNAVRPKSIFDDSAYLPACLEAVMAGAARDFGADRIGTSTWLNSHPRWLALFPAEWQANLEPPEGRQDVRGNYGYWGQFITAQGTFNAKYGARLRATGKLPYPPKVSSCSFAALRDHLKTLR
jgi:hypothetical protein